MKKLLLGLLFSLLISLYVMAQNYRIPEKVVIITKSGVNVRNAPGLEAEVLYKTHKGILFEFVAQKGSWYEVKEAYTEKTVYVSTSVSRILTGDKIPTTEGWIPHSNGPKLYLDFRYEGKAPDYNFETGLSFYYDDEKKDGFLYLTSVAYYSYHNGNYRERSYTYRGYQRGWYMVFDTFIDDEGKATSVTYPFIYYMTNDGLLCNDGAVFKVVEWD